ncbi:MAG: septation protein A [Gammaproteobacteria bacterium]|nr:septation protein A [Gammaproteobacteria bacterium]MDH5593044.1 septation protein A [Gammaproteobacteria bacterium]
MKFLYDFFPILLFFIAYKTHDIYVATGVAIAASFVQVGYYWWKHRRFENMHLITLVLLTVFGGLTIFLHDEMFIKWKPTIVNWLFAMVFLGSHWIGEKTIVERMMSKNITLAIPLWTRLNMSWVLFFVAMGVINLYVVYYYDTDTWVNFKLFGMMGLTFAFVILQAIFLSKHIQQEESQE